MRDLIYLCLASYSTSISEIVSCHVMSRPTYHPSGRTVSPGQHLVLSFVFHAPEFQATHNTQRTYVDMHLHITRTCTTTPNATPSCFHVQGKGSLTWSLNSPLWWFPSQYSQRHSFSHLTAPLRSSPWVWAQSDSFVTWTWK